MPLDALDLPAVLRRIDSASTRELVWLSTPNVNFLMMSRSDEDFVIFVDESDFCPVDGMPLDGCPPAGIPIRERVSDRIFRRIALARSPRSQIECVFCLEVLTVLPEISSNLTLKKALASVGALNPDLVLSRESSDSILEEH